jgi:protein Tex
VAPTTFDAWFRARHPDIPVRGAAAVLELAADGATVPFIARYRKERTGNLDEVAIRRTLASRLRWDQILNRQSIMLEAIERQKKLTPELRETILSTFDLAVLEDLYLPYKQKRQTRASLAREAGLEPLADWIWSCGHGTETPQPGQTLELWAFTFRNEEKGFPDTGAVIQGAQDILTERLAEDHDLRRRVRRALLEHGCVSTRKGAKAKPNSKFETYFGHEEKVQTLLQVKNSHRYLAMRRGAAEGELELSVGGAAGAAELEAGLLAAFETAACSVPESPGAAVLDRAARAALRQHVLPSIEADVHRALKEVADTAAVEVFAENVRQVLLASPFGAKAVLGIDPGLRTGCKLAVVDETGGLVAHSVMFIHTEEGRARAGPALAAILGSAPVRAVAVGNGTAGRETELFVRAALREAGIPVPVVVVSEAGASVYSASDAAREELPELDVSVRGAVSIARRLQDPLAELVKIDPRSIGVGQYQHDVPPHSLKASLDDVVDSCVNRVGADLNTASVHLLAHVAGIGPALSRAIVEHRARSGLFRSRTELLGVPRFSRKTFEQAAGFLRIPDAAQPLDRTGVHPERYGVLEDFAARHGKRLEELLGPGVELVRTASELREGVGEFTFEDIVRELEKPGRDPRDEFVPFAYREDVRELADLKPGMVCPGIVTNVTNFGAFVDIGVHHDGLVHVSQLADRFVKDPRQAVKPGDRVQVRVLEVSLAKGQISLSMRGEPKAAAPPRTRERPKRPRRAHAPARSKAPAPAPPPPETGPRPGKPDAEARSAKPDAGGRTRKPEAGTRPRGAPPRPPVREGFNNPFAALGELTGVKVPGTGGPRPRR